ncbi:MAG: hypothetical protein HPY45_02070 [Anaerolineae bacterium]|nr:hypothetical protein [Anaerolineae bacterium]
MFTCPEIMDELNRLLAEATKQHLHLRLIGGLAIKLHCKGADHPALRRQYSDFDFVVPRIEGRRLEAFFYSMGYEPSREFNLLNGNRRQLYHDMGTGRRVDIFVGDFQMCHYLPLRGRMEIEAYTVPLAELLLSKTQIVELTRRDVLDVAALLLDHPVGIGDHETINITRIVNLCTRRWGLFATTMDSLEKIRRYLGHENPGLNESELQLILERAEEIQLALKSARKPLRWRVRNTIGRRVPWYVKVDEIG